MDGDPRDPVSAHPAPCAQASDGCAALLFSASQVPVAEEGVAWTEIPGSKIRPTSIIHMAFELTMIKASEHQQGAGSLSRAVGGCAAWVGGRSWEGIGSSHPPKPMSLEHSAPPVFQCPVQLGYSSGLWTVRGPEELGKQQ